MNMHEDIFAYTDYKLFVVDFIKQLPRKGKGQLKNVADFIQVNPSLLSQILGGDRHFSPEQASTLCDYMKLTEPEAEYFLALVHYARAGSPRLRLRIENQLERLRHVAKRREVSKKVDPGQILDDQEKALFYSNWYYSAVSLRSTIDDSAHTAESIAKYFQLSKTHMQEILNFLCEVNLCQKVGDHYVAGSTKTYLDRNSPFISRHHMNWRIKALERMSHAKSQDLFYTSPVSVSVRDRAVVRTMLSDLFSSFQKMVEPSRSEELVCLNVDWFGF
jgi:uncharacterized protein (TIGR02147 family)